jgi:enoyl-CoA hydratase/carnithine racemase
MSTSTPTAPLDQRGDVAILNLGADENQVNPKFVARLDAALDVLEQTPGPRALVTTGSGKAYSLGLDLEWLNANPEQASAFLERMQRLLGRLLVSSLPTVAALNGHTFAAGAMFAAAHDVRVMRADRGFFCLPEVDIAMPFTLGMTALLAARLPKPAAHLAMALGTRFGGTDAAAAGVVDLTSDADALLDTAVTHAQGLADKAGPTLAEIKRRLYAPVLDALSLPVPWPVEVPS